jgi:hypothetical protein
MQPDEQAHDLVARHKTVSAALDYAISQERHAIAGRQPTNTRYWGEVVTQVRRVQTTNGLQVVLSNVGNPDYRQDPDQTLPGVPNRIVAAKDLAEASTLCRAYIGENDLGGGNWSGGLVLKDGKEFAKVSYNGRVWALPQRVDDKPIWPVEAKHETTPKKRTIDGVDPLEFEEAIVEIPGYGQVKLSGCYRVAHCSTVPGKFAMDGRRMDFTTYIRVSRDGNIDSLPPFNLHPDGLTNISIKAPKKFLSLVTETLRGWSAEPANAAMFLRNQLADERHDLQVLERNIRFAERELEKKREEANIKRTVVEALRADIEGITPGPKF